MHRRSNRILRLLAVALLLALSAGPAPAQSVSFPSVAVGNSAAGPEAKGRVYEPAGPGPFRAIILAHTCAGVSPQFDTGIDIPVLLLAGDRDDWTPADRCRQMVAGLARPGVVEAVYYPSAYHSFDSKVPDRTVPGAGGKSHRLAYDSAAAPDAEARTRAFFARVLQ